MWLTNKKTGTVFNTDWVDEHKDLSGMSYTDTMEWFQNNSNYDEWYDKVEELECGDEVYWYTDEGYLYTNKYLRAGSLVNHPFMTNVTEDEIKRRVDGIDETIFWFRLNSPISVYRSSDTDIFGNSRMGYEELKSFKGKILSEKGYMSCSTLKKLPGEQTVGGKVMYKINVPSGRGKGAYIPRHSESSNEREFLLARNQQYMVKDVIEDNGKITIEMDML